MSAAQPLASSSAQSLPSAPAQPRPVPVHQPILIEIKATPSGGAPVESFTVPSTGRTLHHVTGWVGLPGQPYPQKFRFLVRDPSAILPGRYELDLASSLYIGQYEALCINTRLGRRLGD